jgi:NTE family protein
VYGYPAPAQVAGILLDAIFLDLIDQDALVLERLNRLLGLLPQQEWGDLRPVDLLVLRPSQDLDKLAAEFESCLPRGIRFLTRGLGGHETSRPALLSLLMFLPEYLQPLIRIGEADVEGGGPNGETSGRKPLVPCAGVHSEPKAPSSTTCRKNSTRHSRGWTAAP